MLTPREREVLELMAQGYESIQIAAVLGTATRTVESHRRHIFAKVGKNNSILVLREFYEFVPKRREDFPALPAKLFARSGAAQGSRLGALGAEAPKVPERSPQRESL